MSIKYKLIRDVWKHPSVKFSEFIDQHNLEICVYERSAKVALPAFFAQIEFGYVKDGAFHLRSKIGDGYDPEDAIENLKRNLAGHVLVIDAFKPAGREIQCPDEWAPEMIPTRREMKPHFPDKDIIHSGSLEITLDGDSDNYNDEHLRMTLHGIDIKDDGECVGAIRFAFSGGVQIVVGARHWYVSPEALFNLAKDADDQYLASRE